MECKELRDYFTLGYEKFYGCAAAKVFEKIQVIRRLVLEGYGLH